MLHSVVKPGPHWGAMQLSNVVQYCTTYCQFTDVGEMLQTQGEADAAGSDATKDDDSKPGGDARELARGFWMIYDYKG